MLASRGPRGPVPPCRALGHRGLRVGRPEPPSWARWPGRVASPPRGSGACESAGCSCPSSGPHGRPTARLGRGDVPQEPDGSRRTNARCTMWQARPCGGHPGASGCPGPQTAPCCRGCPRLAAPHEAPLLRDPARGWLRSPAACCTTVPGHLTGPQLSGLSDDPVVTVTSEGGAGHRAPPAGSEGTAGCLSLCSHPKCVGWLSEDSEKAATPFSPDEGKPGRGPCHQPQAICALHAPDGLAWPLEGNGRSKGPRRGSVMSVAPRPGWDPAHFLGQERPRPLPRDTREPRRPSRAPWLPLRTASCLPSVRASLPPTGAPSL